MMYSGTPNHGTEFKITITFQPMLDVGIWSQSNIATIQKHHTMLAPMMKIRYLVRISLGMKRKIGSYITIARPQATIAGPHVREEGGACRVQERQLQTYREVCSTYNKT